MLGRESAQDRSLSMTVITRGELGMAVGMPEQVQPSSEQLWTDVARTAMHSGVTLRQSGMGDVEDARSRLADELESGQPVGKRLGAVYGQFAPVMSTYALATETLNTGAAFLTDRENTGRITYYELPGSVADISSPR